MAAAQRGENPTVLSRMKTGWAVIGDTQHLPGYCLLLYDGNADHLTDLPPRLRAAFLLDLSLIGEAVQRVCQSHDEGFLRVNYEVLGNSWRHLHGHVHARYSWEPLDRRSSSVWRYGAVRNAAKHRLGSQHAELKAELAAALIEIMHQAYGELG